MARDGNHASNVTAVIASTQELRGESGLAGSYGKKNRAYRLLRAMQQYKARTHGKQEPVFRHFIGERSFR
ncbi:MAG TPA: hypothetical protein VN679_12990, partial [Candidatus Acidoferrales bacterium]|nr:hypothetical protein [Candidatus Acidoferrales bacterium]